MSVADSKRKQKAVRRVLTSDEGRQLRALLYILTPVEMLKVVMEVIQRQRMNGDANVH